MATSRLPVPAEWPRRHAPCKVPSTQLVPLRITGTYKEAVGSSAPWLLSCTCFASRSAYKLLEPLSHASSASLLL